MSPASTAGVAVRPGGNIVEAACVRQSYIQKNDIGHELAVERETCRLGRRFLDHNVAIRTGGRPAAGAGQAPAKVATKGPDETKLSQREQQLNNRNGIFNDKP